MGIQELVENIAKENAWKQSMDTYIAILLNHRIRYQRDLMILSRKTWDMLDIPVMLKIALKARKNVQFVSAAPKLASSFIGQGSIIPIVQFSNGKSVQERPAVNPDKLLNQNVSSSEIVFNRHHIPPNRIIVENEGKTYEIDRFCPHKGYDLTGVALYCNFKAEIKNGMVICPKHKWKFDLSRGGNCDTKECSINARKINDW